MQLLERAIALAPNNPDAHYNLAVARLHQRQPERARADLLDALRLEPGHGGANFNLALMVADGKSPEDALPLLEKARHGGVAPLKTHLVERAILIRLGRDEQAYAALEAVLSSAMTVPQRESLAIDFSERRDCLAARRVSVGFPLASGVLRAVERRCPP